MASLHESIKSHLEGFAGLSSLVVARIYPMRLPQSPTLPAVTYQVFASSTAYRHRGSAGKAETAVQIDAWGASYLSAKAVAEQVRLAMVTFTGTVNGYVIDHADKVGERDLDDPERTIYHVALDFAVWHAEAVA